MNWKYGPEARTEFELTLPVHLNMPHLHLRFVWAPKLSVPVFELIVLWGSEGLADCDELYLEPTKHFG